MITVTFEISENVSVQSAVGELLTLVSGITSSKLVGIGATEDNDDDEDQDQVTAVDTSDTGNI